MAPGIDSITNETLKIIAEQIAKPLTHVLGAAVKRAILQQRLCWFGWSGENDATIIV